MPKAPLQLIQIGCYLRQNQAEERGLVVLALKKPYWILETEGLYSLFVAAEDAEELTCELEKFEAERVAELHTARREWLSPPPPKPRFFSLHVFTWAMLFFYALQQHQGARWLSMGEADSVAILVAKGGGPSPP